MTITNPDGFDPKPQDKRKKRALLGDEMGVMGDNSVKWNPKMADKMMATKALRYDDGKLDWTLLDFAALESLVKVMTYGATKYERENWKKQNDDPMQHIRCAFRHLIAIAKGEEIDPESGEPHSAHVAANMMMFNYHKYVKK